MDIHNYSTTITSYLPFSDDRLQFFDIHGWDGQVIKINRQFYIDLIRNQMNLELNLSDEKKDDIINEILNRTENIDGIYILFGEDVKDLSEGIAYIGETSNFKRRMKQHFASYESNEKGSNQDDPTNEEWEFFSDIFFFSKSLKMGGAGLGESLRKAIEAKIIQEAKTSEYYRVLNKTEKYSGKLNLIDKDILEDFFSKIKTLLKHLGNPLLKEKIMIDETDEINYFICTERSANATMYRANTGIVVLKNSIIVKDYINTFPKQKKKIFERRRNLIEEGVLESQANPNTYILKEDQEFNSASGAAAFVSGGHYSGYLVWKKKTDPEITLGDFLKLEQES